MKRIMKNGSIQFVKVYGSEMTSVVLTDKAQKFYNGTDPLHIYERDGLYAYDMFGGDVTDWMSLDKLNADLEALYDEMFDEDDAE